MDKIGIFIFFATILCLIFSSQLHLTTWSVALVGSLLMVLFGVVDQKSALRDIPWDMLMLFVGALALGTSLTNTGAGDLIGNTLATVVGGTHNNYILGALFFIIPFLLTQFMLNRSVSAVFVPICLLTCSALGANPTGLVLLVNAGSLTAFLTPMGHAGRPHVHGRRRLRPQEPVQVRRSHHPDPAVHLHLLYHDGFPGILMRRKEQAV